MTMSRTSRPYSTLKWALVVFLGSVGLGATETVSAAPRYSGSITGAETVNASPSPVVLTNYFQMNDVDSENNGIGVKTNGAQATASSGRLQGVSYADYLNSREFFPIFSGSGTGTQGGSDFFLDNLVITGPPGNILVSFNFSITGGLITTASGPNLYGAAHARARVINLQSSFGGGGSDLGSIDVDSSGFRSATGVFSTLDMGGTVMGTTASILTYAGDTAIQFWLGLETSAGVTVGFGAGLGNAYASSGFFASLGSPTSGLVANLPEGYGLNSTDGRIVDNHLVPPQPGDVNWDGVVNIFDINLVSSQWGKSGPVGDANGDLAVNIFDINLISSNWTATDGAAAVPEPATLWLSVLALTALLPWRRSWFPGK